MSKAQHTPGLFLILSTNEYIWRWQITGASHNWVKCWHVFDLQGNMVAGGHRTGNNTKSGHAIFPRKRDAQAWADGYSNPDLSWMEYSKSKGIGYSDNAYASFQNGQLAAEQCARAAIAKSKGE